MWKIVASAPFDNFYTGAVYVYDINGVTTSQPGGEIKITASDSAVADFFGESLATGCGKIVVGAQYKDVGSNTQQGQVYIYDVDGSNEIKLTASDGGGMDHFGNSVAVGCGKIVVAAVGKNITATNSFGQTNTYYNTGGFYIYDLDGTNEIIVDDPFPSNGQYTDYRDFAYKVAIGCGRIVVSDPLRQQKLLWQQQQGGAPVRDVGAAYVYDLQGNLLNTLSPHALEEDGNDSGEDMFFGSSLAIGDGLIVVGSPGWDVGDNDGAVHVFDINLNPLYRFSGTPGSKLGYSVGVGNGRIVFGAPYHNQYVPQSDGSQQVFYDAGAVYVTLARPKATTEVEHPDIDNYERFGKSVDIGNGIIVVGRPDDDINGNTNIGSVEFYEIPEVYTLYDLIDMEYGD